MIKKSKKEETEMDKIMKRQKQKADLEARANKSIEKAKKPREAKFDDGKKDKGKKE